VIFLIIAVVLALFGGVHLYLWKRLVHDVSAPGSRWRRTGSVPAVVLSLLSLGALIGGRALPLAAERWLAWPGYMWPAVLLYLTLALLVREFLRPLLRRAPVPTHAQEAPQPDPDPDPEPDPDPDPDPEPAPVPADPGRRLFVARTVAIGAAAAATATVGYGTYGVLRGPRLKYVTVPLAKAPATAGLHPGGEAHPLPETGRRNTLCVRSNIG
jgi:MFS family permease